MNEYSSNAKISAVVQAWRSLPEFVRTTYSSSAVQQECSPLLTQINGLWGEVEEHSVYKGLRSAALLMTEPAKLPGLIERAEAAGFGCRTVGKIRLARHYTSRSEVPRPGEAFLWRVVVARGTAIDGMVAAIEKGSDDAIGGWLGYPDCCREFFKKAWANLNLIDVTHAQLGEKDELEVGPVPLNPLLRWIGVRPVFHLPCSFDCQPSVEIAKTLGDLAGELGSKEVQQKKEELLAAPVEWSSNHGIGQVLHPHFRIVFSSDWTPKPRVLRIRGEPIAGAPAGDRFPYFNRPSTLVQIKRRTSIADEALAMTSYEANGFVSEGAMTRAHAAVEKGLLRFRSRAKVKKHSMVVDLGSGDGSLLHRLQKAGVEANRWIGVERVLKRVEHGRRRHPNIEHRHETIEEFLLNDDSNFDSSSLVIVNPLRFAEMDMQVRMEATEKLLRTPRPLVFFYSYDQRIEKSVEELASEAGLAALFEEGFAEAISAHKEEPC